MGANFLGGRLAGRISRGLGCSLEFPPPPLLLLTSAFPSSFSGWHPPPQGGFKFNTDPVVPSDGSSFNIGAVIRDAKGQVVLVVSKCLRGHFSVEVCEALALREGLCLAKQHCLSVGWAEVDTANVAAGVNSSKPCKSVACFVFDDISSLCKDVGVFSCMAISRVGNGLAHNLTSLAISSLRDHLWQGYCPSFLCAGC
ncbi:hypothetical protein Ddye_011490 [Dipteronia dyeriana]|uniref:RNase H type-1 domain-containing protein n=1 Tax=Dipteronia dyeriana TaxID=168575 RepID=A0AAD9X2K9_9ROSI|nr:hypothetical protein Ddye_011490 [Dipteronia dyeriana]